MRLLTQEEKKKRIADAISAFERRKKITIYEPCDCGSRIRHNNGGNYHEILFLEEQEGRLYIKQETTCDLLPPEEWTITDRPFREIIEEYVDWL